MRYLTFNKLSFKVYFNLSCKCCKYLLKPMGLKVNKYFLLRIVYSKSKILNFGKGNKLGWANCFLSSAHLYQSARRAFTGLVVAALAAWKLTVSMAIARANEPASTNIPQVIGTR